MELENITTLSKEMDSLPEMPGVKRISTEKGKLSCFTVSLSEITKNKGILSSEYYDTKSQAQMLIDKINSYDSIDKIIIFFKKAISNGYIIKNGNKLLINSVITKKLKEVCEEFDKNA